MDAVVKVKDERLNIVKDAVALFKCRKADKKWIIKQKGNNYREVYVSRNSMEDNA